MFIIEFFYFIHCNAIRYLDFSIQREILQIDLKDEKDSIKSTVKCIFKVTGIYGLNISLLKFLRQHSFIFTQIIKIQGTQTFGIITYQEFSADCDCHRVVTWHFIALQSILDEFFTYLVHVV